MMRYVPMQQIARGALAGHERGMVPQRACVVPLHVVGSLRLHARQRAVPPPVEEMSLAAPPGDHERVGAQVLIQ